MCALMEGAKMAMSEKQRAWHTAHKYAKCEYDRAYRAANKERLAAAKAKYVIENPEADRARKTRYREVHRGKLRADGIAYNRANAGKVRFWAMNRHTAKLQRTPAWLTKDDLWIIQQAYELAALRTRLFGVPWHVDHVLPLQGKTVSGLHVPTNLQVILGVENARKGNRA
jgi:hypothetical protein